MSQITITNVGYRSTNYWVVSAGTSRLLIDLGWPGTLGRMKANLNRLNVPLREIRCGLATHYHIDHAGPASSSRRYPSTIYSIVSRRLVLPISRRSSWIS